MRVSLLEEEEQKLLCFSLFVQPKAPLINISTTSRMEERGKRGGEAEETGRESAVVMKNRRRRKTSRESFVAKIISLPLFCLVCFFSFLFSGPRRALSKRRKKNARGLPTSRFPGQKLAPPLLRGRNFSSPAKKLLSQNGLASNPAAESELVARAK